MDSDRDDSGHAPLDAESSRSDESRILQVVTDMNSANLIADIVGHPQGAPSVAELEFMNPSLTDDSIHHHLGKLVEADLVEVLEVPQGQRNERIPHEFYRLTPNARELFDRNGLFPEAAWRRQYDAVEKTPEIRTIEEIPRPER